MRARITVTLKNGVLDPQGQAIEGALSGLGFTDINSVRQGKTFEIDLNETDRDKAQTILNDMCEKLLANTVIEDYRVRILG
ncbi:MAG: phosphoribosylformylglycinamidine synthase subunit PurS [Devosiaceae bacterium]|nr:phosphoribosylformylglycinamidine synthase subunit PurS [Devosiaceae bacterium]